MVQVHIPFSLEYANRLVAETKTATTRYKRYGNRADFFRFMYHIYCLDEVKLVYLYRVASECFKAEGFNSEQEFIDAWIHHHPDKGYRPNDVVYYHRFFRET